MGALSESGGGSAVVPLESPLTRPMVAWIGGDFDDGGEGDLVGFHFQHFGGRSRENGQQPMDVSSGRCAARKRGKIGMVAGGHQTDNTGDGDHGDRQDGDGDENFESTGGFHRSVTPSSGGRLGGDRPFPISVTLSILQ